MPPPAFLCFCLVCNLVFSASACLGHTLDCRSDVEIDDQFRGVCLRRLFTKIKYPLSEMFRNALATFWHDFRLSTGGLVFEFRINPPTAWEDGLDATREGRPRRFSRSRPG